LTHINRGARRHAGGDAMPPDRNSAGARRFVLAYAAVLLASNLLWEIAQLPLYTIWSTAPPNQIVFAVIHCTAGDLLIGVAALAVALTIIRPQLPPPRLGGLAAVTIIGALAYTILSEWLNVSVRGTWAYAPAMPVLPVVGTGVSPLAQWVVTPLVALVAARRVARRRV
jgi:hypothetical protein